MLFNIDEKQLMLELKNKDERALKICMNKYYRYVVYIVENIIGSALPYEDKEEVVSNVFVALWNYSADLDTDNYSTFKPYLGTIARNMAKNALRKTSKMHFENYEDAFQVGTNEHIEYGPLKEEVIKCLKESIYELSVDERKCFISYYYYTKTIAVIAEETGLKESTVKSKLLRGRKKLKLKWKRRDLDMKTVKFSLNELMSEIDESFIEEVYFHDCNKILKKYSKQKIRQNVFCKTASKHKPLKFTYRTAIIVTVVSVFLCMPVYAAISHLLTSALIDDSNRHLIGTETNDRSYIILKDGVYTNEKGKVVDIEELAKSSSEFPESRIVKSSLMPNFIPSSIVEIPTDKSDEMYIIPEIILINNSLCVLTQDNGKGWELTDKDNIVISFDKYKSDITVSQDLIIGYVKDGIMYEGEVFDELSGKYSFSPDEKGEYFFYLLSGSSDYLSLKSGNLEVN